MSQLDRGAYTPQTDAPLAFDARAPRGPRKPLPVALIGSGVVLVAVVAGVAMYYQGGVRAPGGEPPAVGAPVGEVKTAAPASAKTDDPFSNLDVYAAQNVPATPTVAKPTFAPPPEAPAPRPAPGLKVQTVDSSAIHAVPAHAAPTPAAPALAMAAAAPKPAVPTATAKPAAPVTMAAAAPAGPVGAANAQLHLAAKPATPAAAKPVAIAAATPPAVPAAAAPGPAAAGGSASVQIGAFSSTVLAEKGYQEVAAAFPGTVAGKSKRVEPLARDGKTLYRTSVVGFASRGAAQAFCDALSARGKHCIVKS